MGDLRALRPKDISAQVVVDSLREIADEVEHIYVVCMMKEGEPSVYASGNLGSLCHASMIFQDYAMRHVRGEIE